MAVLPNASRRRRYEPRGQAGALTLTPKKVALLEWVGELGLACVPQLAALVDVTPQAVRRHLRELFDHDLLRVIPTSRLALADPTASVDPSLIYGSAPNIYSLTRAGVRTLGDLGREVRAGGPQIAPRNSQLLAHELAIRDVRVWLELAARPHSDYRLERWECGGSAEIALQRSQPPKVARPDAWFVFRLGERVLVGLVEVDRGTERGTKRWIEKVSAYRHLFTGSALPAATGYQNARVLVIAPSVRRRDAISKVVAAHTSGELAARFWLAERSVLDEPRLSQVAWVKPGDGSVLPLLTEAGERREGVP